MSSTAHFLLVPLIFWGKTCYQSLYSSISKDAHLIGHIRPFSILATRLVLEQENVVVTFIVSPDFLDKTVTEISRQFLNEPSKDLQRIR